MTVKEMHIGFSLGLQKLGANSRRKFEKEEIDYVLNKMQDQFILDQVKVTEDEQGFLSTQVDVDKIRPLVVQKDMQAYALSKGYEAALPSDYSHLISNTWYVGKACFKTANTSDTEYAYVIPFHKTTKVSAPFYSILKLTYDGVDIVDVPLHSKQGTAAVLYTGLKAVEDHFTALNLVLDLFHERASTGQLPGNIKGLYYERYKNLYYPGQLILVSTELKVVSSTIDAVANPGVGINAVLTKHNASVYTSVPGRQVKASKVDSLLSTPFYGPTPNSPISVLSGTKMTVYAHKSYIVNKASMTYVRKASRIDLSLQRNCELAPEFRPTIVEMAVEYAAGRLEQQTLYQVAAAENIRNK